MKSLIIAAGRGKRIPKFTKKIPKCLIKISNKPIIARQIDTFRKNKIKTKPTIVDNGLNVLISINIFISE